MENYGTDYTLGGIGILALLILSFWVESIRHAKRQEVVKKVTMKFLLECAVADEIVAIEYKTATLVLAKRRDGKWGIANRDGWLHVGKGNYIATKWKQHTGQWPYIYY
tara:strand:- start:1884 stop:2207 length:324 start_codon:yes stop_codon:yes gene_type:complete